MLTKIYGITFSKTQYARISRTVGKSAIGTCLEGPMMNFPNACYGKKIQEVSNTPSRVSKKTL